MDVPTFAELNINAALPAAGLALWACVVLLLDLFVPKAHKFRTMLLALAGVAVAFVHNLTLFNLPPEDQTAFSGMYRADGFSTFVNVVALLATFLGLLVAYEYLKRTGVERGEYYPLILISASGTMFMGAANNLVILFVAIELLSIPLYILSGFWHGNRASEESAIKYFLLGAFSSAFMVYGIALIYGAVGSTDLPTIFEALSNGLMDDLLLTAGAGMMLVGLGFKVAAVPFHMWTPDVYQGAPTPVTAYMSVGAKVGGFAGMLRAFAALPAAQGGDAAFWQGAVIVLAALTMILGNVVALAQRDIKRMLAYSSIAHAGYLLMGVAALAAPDGATVEAAVGAVLFYLLAYAFTNLGAFGVVIMVERDDGTGTRISDFAGLYRSRPWMALALALFMFSLTGFPPTAGMIGKVFLFRAAVDAGLDGLALVGLITSLFSAFYYMRVVVNIYMEAGSVEAAQPRRSYLGAAVVFAAIGTLIFGLLPLDLGGIARLIVGG